MITDYASLKTEVATWLSRADQTSNIDTFIDNFEAWFNRNVRSRKMETVTTSLTITSGVITNPTDWLAWKDLKITTAPIQHLDVYTEETGDFRWEAGGAARPLRAIVRGDTTVLLPTPSDTTLGYQGIYYAKLPSLDGTTTTNWLLTAHSDLYLAGSMFEACALIQDTAKAPYWKSLRDEKCEELKAMSRSDSRYGGSLMPRIRAVV